MDNPFSPTSGGRRLTVAVERNVPFIAGVIEPYADVRYLDAGEFTPQSVKDADAIIVRTRTRCDQALLGRSRCRTVITATIGTDHIDTAWCASRGIAVVNAPGCNAPAVAQYVMASALTLSNRPLPQYCIGIVGAGHVGSIVERWALGLDMKVLVCDPPRQRAGQLPAAGEWSSLGDIARSADIITFHTPLTATGPDATLHLAGDAFFSSLRRAPVIINSARGPVTDTPALVRALDDGLVSAAAIDCWEGEPAISHDLLDRAAIATPHIAGYSHDGKVRATQMALDALSARLMLPRMRAAAPLPSAVARTVTPTAVAHSYNPLADTMALKADPAAFETLRNRYRYRSEVPEARPD